MESEVSWYGLYPWDDHVAQTKLCSLRIAAADTQRIQASAARLWTATGRVYQGNIAPAIVGRTMGKRLHHGCKAFGKETGDRCRTGTGAAGSAQMEPSDGSRGASRPG
jgi:hypothetical protein